MVATDDRTAPATAGFISSGWLRVHSPIAPIVALLETKPEAKPARQAEPAPRPGARQCSPARSPP